MYEGEFRFSMQNPSTRQYRYLPVCDFVVPPNYSFHNIVGWGLGYDDSIDDYKAFCIVNVKEKHRPSLHKLQVQIWIYELKSNIWRKAPQCFPFLKYKLDVGGCIPGVGHFSDNSMHWLIHDDASKFEIAAFDVRNETFSLVPQLVCPIKSMGEVSAELHVLEGSLCISYRMEYHPFHAYLYMRKNDGVDRFKWTELYSVTEPWSVGIRSFSYMKVLGYSKRGDKILLHFYMDGMVWCDLKKKHFAKVEVDINPYCKFPILCLESLVSVGGCGS